ncbi:hypothetical protein AAVH_40758, partial [Aphelenchoides avenae]
MAYNRRQYYPLDRARYTTEDRVVLERGEEDYPNRNDCAIYSKYAIFGFNIIFLVSLFADVIAQFIAFSGRWSGPSRHGSLATNRQSLPRLPQRAVSAGGGRGFLAGTHALRLLLHSHRAGRNDDSGGDVRLLRGHPGLSTVPGLLRLCSLRPAGLHLELWRLHHLQEGRDRRGAIGCAQLHGPALLPGTRHRARELGPSATSVPML